jgi:DNA helicase-2/ATP-dependent DNA helicase PcrA
MARKKKVAQEREDVVAELLEGSNPEQQQAIIHNEGPAIVLAGAGSGKTRSVVHRVAYLVRVEKVDAAGILAVTFSKAAADEMNARLVALLGETQARIGTFHSWSWEVVRNERPAYKEWKVDDRDRYRTLIKDAVGFRHLNWRDADVTKLSSYIGYAKAEAAKPGSAESLELARGKFAFGWQSQQADAAFAQAEKLRLDERLITFDDMLTMALDLMDDPGVLGRWMGRYTHVIQDEAQDVNRVQNELARKVASAHRNYMVVGDSQQAIYGFRGARPDYILKFEQDWPGAKVIHLHRNYRSGSRIINAANRIIDTSPSKLPFSLSPERGIEGQIDFTLRSDMDDEGDHVVERIQESLGDGHSYRDCAVLYRTNAQSRGPEEKLLSAKIPYVVIGGTNFYDRKEVKDLLAYLRLGEGRGTADDVRRCINSPFRFLGKVFVERLMGTLGDPLSWTERVRETSRQAGIQRRQQDSAEAWSRILEATALDIASGTEPMKVLDELVQATGYVEWLRMNEGEESPENSRISNVKELVRAAGRFKTVTELLDYIDEVVKSARKAKAGADSGEQPNRVKLMSIHRSKGLEWPVVFVIGMNEGILPHGRTDNEDEERRLAYVAVTRGRDVVHCSAVRSAAVGAKVVELAVSRYAIDAGLVDVQPEPVGGVSDVA